jgi:F-type H+-transporting ATPase subunit delta
MSQLANRYATALFEVTEKNSTTSQVLALLETLKTSLRMNPDVINLIKTPMLSDGDKEAIIKSALGDSVPDEMSSFIKLLTKNNRLHDLPVIAEAFEQKVTHSKGLLKGTVSSAMELSADEKNSIRSMIEKKLQSKVELSYQIRPEMIGGIEAKVGSFLFEDSVKSHMSKLNDFITRRVQ